MLSKRSPRLFRGEVPFPLGSIAILDSRQSGFHLRISAPIGFDREIHGDCRARHEEEHHSGGKHSDERVPLAPTPRAGA
jgi:hypothetical protein